MTYEELQQDIQQIPSERLRDTVTVYDPLRDEYIPVVCTHKAENNTVRFLVGHIYLVLKT